jgi:hypothetical protein
LELRVLTEVADGPQIRELQDYTRRRWAIVLNVSMIFCTVRAPYAL